jgi:hypothetical protein
MLYLYIFSVGSGLNVMLCLQCLWEYYHKERVQITAFVFTAFYIGNYSFTKTMEFLMNSSQEVEHRAYNVQEECKTDDEMFITDDLKNNFKVYCPHVALEVPQSTIMLMIMFFGFKMVGICLIERINQKKHI